MIVKDYDLAKEILMVLPYVDKNYLKKLSWSFINNLNELAALSTKNFHFEKGKTFLEMDVSDECKDFLALLYFNEVDIKEKKDLLNMWNYNENQSN